MIKKIAFAITLTFSAFGLTSCVSSTQLVESWYDKSYVAEAKFESVLVLGVFQDDTRRRTFESKFVELVNASGKQAVAGYTLMPKEEDYNDEQDIADAVSKANVDAVLITSFKGVDEQQRYVPSAVDYAPAMTHGGYYGSYYGSAYRRVYSPGYTVTDTVVSLETRIYAVSPKKLVWAGNTKSVNSASTERISEELIKRVTDDIRASGLIE